MATMQRDPANPGRPELRRATSDTPERPPYVPPRLEPLGAWSALTLQQSVPIGPGSFLAPSFPFA